jgi:hypothetical protein
METPDIKQHYSAGLKINRDLLQAFNEADDRDLLGETKNHTQCEEVGLENLEQAGKEAADFLKS